MNEKKEIIEFLSLPENMKFLLELQEKGLITQAIDHKYKVACKQFVDNFIKPKVETDTNWLGYSCKESPNELRLINNRFRNMKDDIGVLCPAVWVGGVEFGGNHGYGIIGNPVAFNNNDIPEVVELKKQLTEYEVTGGQWRNFVAWAFFDLQRNRKLLLLETRVDVLHEFFSAWADEFWNFVDGTKDILEKVNTALAQQPYDKQ